MFNLGLGKALRVISAFFYDRLNFIALKSIHYL